MTTLTLARGVYALTPAATPHQPRPDRREGTTNTNDPRPGLLLDLRRGRNEARGPRPEAEHLEPKQSMGLEDGNTS